MIYEHEFVEGFRSCCDTCCMEGPKGATEEEAVERHNALPRREEIHAELIELREKIEAVSKKYIQPPQRWEIQPLMSDMKTGIEALVEKYKKEMKDER